jgi:cell division cycle 20-like protein 1 (cofactor of APC complex)
MSGGRKSPSKPPVYSDRFVPSRSASAGLRGFKLLDSDPPTASTSRPSSEREDTSAAYSTLLCTELLGDAEAPVGVSSTKTSPRGEVGWSRQYSHSSPSRNLFRFKSDGVAGLGTPPESPYSLSPVGGDGPLGTPVATPRRSPRKIALRPLQALDAPALQDSFNLNLVDWSAHDVVAVGLGTCVWLWSACTSRVGRHTHCPPRHPTRS